MRKLPDVRKGNTARPWQEILPRRCAPRGGRTGVVDRPIFYFSAICIFPDILRGHDGSSRTFPGSNARAVHTGGKVCRLHSIDPRMKISSLFRKETTALFLIEEDDCL